MYGIHCMLDFETLGNRPSTAVVSLGAVLFTKSEITAKKEWTFNVEEQLARGRTIDYPTLQWWMKQSDAARAVFQRPSGVSLEVFGEEFKEFVKPAGPKVCMWGNGADFDVSILADIWTRFIRKPLPWAFYNGRCFRTFNALYNCKDLVERKGVYHNALDDAIYQAECVIAGLNKKT